MPAASARAADGERILLLECRLEQLRSALDQARAEADGVRVKLADVAVREADHARRYGLIQQELADARAEVASLHERLDRSEALRAELEGHLFEAGARGDAAELVRLRREVLAQRQRAVMNERTCTRLRARVDELFLSRETLLTRVAEWQRLIQKEGPAAADLAEFMAELRGDILHLEHRNAAGERQEAALRDRLVRAGLDPDEPAAEHVPAALVEALEGQPIPELLPLEGEVLHAAGSASGDALAARTTVTLEPVTSETGTAAAGTPEDDRTDAAETTERGDLGDGAFAATADDEIAPDASSGQGEAKRAVRAQPAGTDRSGTAARESVSGETTVEGRTADSTEPASAPEAKTAAPVGETFEPMPVGVGTAAAAAAPEREERNADAVAPPVEGLDAADPSARAAAYERLIRVLESDPARLAENLRPGLADPHPRVRRRAVLAAATSQRLQLHPLLEPLQHDPDPHVRRVVREVLRHVSRAKRRTEDADDRAVPASARILSETRS